MCYIVEDTFEFSPLILYSSQRRWWNMAQMSLFRTSKVRGHLSVLNDKVIPPVHATWWLWRPACLWLHRWSSLPSNSMSKQAAFLKKKFLQTFQISKINRRSSTSICFTTYGPPQTDYSKNSTPESNAAATAVPGSQQKTTITQVCLFSPHCITRLLSHCNEHVYLHVIRSS